MERISDDDLLNILERVATSGVRHFLRFRGTLSRDWRLAKAHEVLRALPKNCLSFLTDPKTSVGKRILIQRISDSGHPTFCVARAAQLFHETYFVLAEVRQILLRANSYGTTEAKYFLMILEALASDEFSPENVFLVFDTLFERKQLSNCRRDLTWIPGYYSSRPLPRELDYRFMCHSYKTYKGSGRKQNVFSPPPRFDDDYFMTDICLFCRFGANLSR